MKQDQDLDQMMEDFLSNHVVEDAGFSDKVMAQIPAPSRWLWVEDVYPALALLMVILSVWKFDVMTPSRWNKVLSQMLVLLDLNINSVSVTVSTGFLAGLAVVAGYFFYEKFIEEI